MDLLLNTSHPKTLMIWETVTDKLSFPHWNGALLSTKLRYFAHVFTFIWRIEVNIVYLPPSLCPLNVEADFLSWGTLPIGWSSQSSCPELSSRNPCLYLECSTMPAWLWCGFWGFTLWSHYFQQVFHPLSHLSGAECRASLFINFWQLQMS